MVTMTREDFLKELGELDTEWHLVGPCKHLRMLRNVTGWCPLTALARARGIHVDHKTTVDKLAKAVGLDVELAWAIVDASNPVQVIWSVPDDGSVGKLQCDEELRTQMIEAVGLA